jgi:hypothetical protein
VPSFFLKSLRKFAIAALGGEEKSGRGVRRKDGEGLLIKKRVAKGVVLVRSVEVPLGSGGDGIWLVLALLGH